MTRICYRLQRQCNFSELLELPFNEGNDFNNTITSWLGDFNTDILVPCIKKILLMLFIILKVDFSN